jgi:hypothetical protein
MSRAGRAGVTASVHLPGELIIADGVPAGTPAEGNGHNGVTYAAPVVPAQPQARTPIFDHLVSNWFAEQSPDPAAPAAPRSQNWVTPADGSRRAAQSAVQPPTSSVISPAGLPTRRPGAQLAPGAPLPRPAKATAQLDDFRDPAAVRHNLSRHYNGMRAARQRTANEERS